MTAKSHGFRSMAGLNVLILFFGAASFFGCEQQNTYVEPPPPKVTVARPLQQDVTDYLEFTGTTDAVEAVEVRARVPGFLESKHFTPGTRVEKGDLLFVIEPKQYQAEFNAAKAEVASAVAQRQRAKIELERAQRLFKQRAGAEADVVKWRGERDVAAAAVVRAQARVEQAELNLAYTQVTAPVSGRVGRNLVDVGNLVGEKEPTLLTTVTRYDPMYAYFNLNERDLLKMLGIYREEIEAKGVDPDVDPATLVQIPLYLGLANEDGYPHVGQFDFGESAVDAGTGTLQMRGVFPNPGKVPILLPGLFVRVRMPVEERKGALLVTERAVGSDQIGRYLMVVDGDNTVEKRPVRIGQLLDGLVVVLGGLNADERVVVNGIQRARPGGKVDPEETDMAQLKASVSKAAMAAKPSPAEEQAASLPESADPVNAQQP